MVDRITPEMAAEVRAMLAEVCTITSEEVTTHRMTFNRGPKLGVPTRRLLDVEGEIYRKFGNAPYCLYSDVDRYRFQMTVN